MAVTYATAVKSARLTATRDHFADGSLEILHSDGTTVIVSFGLALAGGSVAGAVWTLAFDATTVAATAGGTPTTARLKTSGGASNLTGLTVGTTGTDIILDNAGAITIGQNITLNGAQTITHAP